MILEDPLSSRHIILAIGTYVLGSVACRSFLMSGANFLVLVHARDSFLDVDASSPHRFILMLVFFFIRCPPSISISGGCLESLHHAPPSIFAILHHAPPPSLLSLFGRACRHFGHVSQSPCKRGFFFLNWPELPGQASLKRVLGNMRSKGRRCDIYNITH